MTSHTNRPQDRASGTRRAAPPHASRARPSHGRDRKLSAEEINAHPVASYQGPIHVIDSDSQVEIAVRAMRREAILGFDTETRPTFRKGEHYPPALLQLAGEHAVWVFRLSIVGLPQSVAAILADPAVVKAGVSNTRDLAELRQLTDFVPAGFVDLGHAAKEVGIPHHGLRGLAAVFLSCRISKSAQLTNWARPDLPARALQYAATDAWIGRRLYEAMREHDCLGSAAPAPPHGKRGNLQADLKSLLNRAMWFFSRRPRTPRDSTPS
ncbi:MAG: 3'-5' exonuclease domain-containing protein 2 [Lentisphaerae bacterium]|nr:3'-5' exonuclease domain-containing protein 2 [Lentisphaerota bacterium]